MENYDLEKKELAVGLRRMRKKHNLSQENVAKVLHINRSSYASYELAKTTISIFGLISLFKFYNISFNEFIRICKD